jgi:polyhydroxyalkanoate synthase
VAWSCWRHHHSAAIPPRSILPFHHAATSPNKKVLRYHGDQGVALQHVGVLIGANAHNALWPEILDWIHHLPGPRSSCSSCSSGWRVP